MNVGPMGMASSVSGSLPQTRSADAEKTQQQTTEQSRQAASSEKAEQAAGVGETEQDEQASDRDADGRRLWEGNQNENQNEEQEADADSATGQQDPKSRDPSGQRGGNLDLSG